jgi:hypothetical protein
MVEVKRNRKDEFLLKMEMDDQINKIAKANKEKKQKEEDELMKKKQMIL